MLRNTHARYGSLAKWLHWLMALVVITMIVLGYFTQVTAKGPGLSQLFFYHKALGVTLFIIVVASLIWRWSNPTPKHNNLPKSQVVISHIVHYLLYFGLLVMILAGWGMSSWGGHPVNFWGWFDASWPVAKNKPLKDIADATHWYLAWGLSILIVIHTVAALFHHFIQRDDILRGILPSKNKSMFK